MKEIREQLAGMVTQRGSGGPVAVQAGYDYEESLVTALRPRAERIICPEVARKVDAIYDARVTLVEGGVLRRMEPRAAAAYLWLVLECTEAHLGRRSEGVRALIRRVGGHYFYDRGVEYVNAGHDEEAERELTRALRFLQASAEADDLRVKTLMTLGVCLYNLGSRDEARKRLHEAVSEAKRIPKDAPEYAAAWDDIKQIRPLLNDLAD